MTDGPHRRDFVRTLALGAAGLVAGAPARADDDPKPDEDPAEARRKAEVEARMDLVLARYGEKLDEEARKAVRRDVEVVDRRGERMRQYAMENGDGPFPVFRPYRAGLA